MAGSGMSALGGLGGNHLDALSQRGLGGASSAPSSNRRGWENAATAVCNHLVVKI